MTITVHLLFLICFSKLLRNMDYLHECKGIIVERIRLLSFICFYEEALTVNPFIGACE
jgi:hypothetical protein